MISMQYKDKFTFFSIRSQVHAYWLNTTIVEHEFKQMPAIKDDVVATLSDDQIAGLVINNYVHCVNLLSYS